MAVAQQAAVTVFFLATSKSMKGSPQPVSGRGCLLTPFPTMSHENNIANHHSGDDADYSTLIRKVNFRTIRNGTIAWDPVLVKLQRMYDRKWMYLKRIARLRLKAFAVRRVLQVQGIDQLPLLRGSRALSDIEGVIYVIWSPLSHKLYVGQTMGTAFSRFQQHVWKSFRSNAPLHRLMRSLGFRNFFVYPLEVISRDYLNQSGRMNQRRYFRSLANERECYWIERLHTYAPRGLNIKFRVRNRNRPHRRNNPMKWVRERTSLAHSHRSDNLADINSVGLGPNVSFCKKTQILGAHSLSLSDPKAQVRPDQGVKNSDKRAPHPSVEEGSKASPDISALEPEIQSEIQTRSQDPVDSFNRMAGRLAGRTIPIGKPKLAVRWFAYRDYHRRCLHLAHRFNKGTLENVKFDNYRRSNLWRMLLVVESKSHTLEPAAAAAIAAKLREYLLTRYKTQAKAKARATPIVVEWQSRDMRILRLRNILELDTVRSLYPGDWPEVVIARRLPRTISSLVYNFSRVASTLQSGSSDNCPCRNLFPAKFRKLRNCVYTGDLSVVRYTKLRSILAYGANFRTKVLQPNMVEAIGRAIESFASKQSEAEGIDSSLFKPWVDEVLRIVRNRLPEAASAHGVSWCKRSRKYLKFLQRYLVLVPTDKAFNNASFICKNLYVDILKEELESSGAYEVSQRSKEQLIMAHKRFLKPRNLFGHKKLGHIYALPKMHKAAPKSRFIAALFKCLTTKLSVVLTSFLNRVLNTLRDKDNAYIRSTGIRRFFVVNGYEEVADFLHRTSRGSHDSTRKLYTGDFSTMYTTIPHKDLINKLRLCLEEAWNWVATQNDVDVSKVRLMLTGSKCEWVFRSARSKDVHENGRRVLSMAALMELLQFLVYNTFVINGDVIRKQVIGIPMGTNCAPLLANLYLYAYESTFIDRLSRAKGSAAARSFHMTFRLIDDVLSVDNPLLDDYINYPALNGDQKNVGGIYPSVLTLNDTSLEDRVQFLGMEIKYSDGSLLLDVFDKKKEFPFEVIRYPHLDSVIPTSIPYGVFTGLLYRRYRICNRKSVFLNRCVELAMILLNKGCTKRRLCSLFRKFLLRWKPLKWKGSFQSLFRQFLKRLGN